MLTEISQERMVDNDLTHRMNLQGGTHTKMKQKSGYLGSCVWRKGEMLANVHEVSAG